jgi:imidazolonepropionase-like amidohydrolase
MGRQLKELIALILLGVGSFSATAQTITAVRLGKLWDGDCVIDRAVVVIEPGRIRSVQGGNPEPAAGAKVIDWSRYYAIPGMIDVHTHMTYVSDMSRMPQLQHGADEEGCRNPNFCRWRHPRSHR